MTGWVIGEDFAILRSPSDIVQRRTYSSRRDSVLDHMLNIAFPICNGLAIVLVLVAAPWHLKARNPGTLLFLFWSFVSVVPTFINSIIWYKNTANVAPVWCDIVTKLMLGAQVGTPAATLCIARQLEAIAAARFVTNTAKDRRRKLIEDCLVGLGIPVLVMALHIVVQGHRFDIFEGAGCRPTYYWSYPAIFIILLPPLVLCLVAAVYCGLAMRLLIVRRHQFAKVLQSSSSAISTSRFVRLIALASVQIIYSTPLTILVIVGNIVAFPPKPYTSWDDVHYGFSQVIQASAHDLASSPRFYIVTSELGYWSCVVSCVAFFLFFGLGEEAKSTYKGYYLKAFGKDGQPRRIFKTPTLCVSTRPKRLDKAVSPASTLKYPLNEVAIVVTVHNDEKDFK